MKIQVIIIVFHFVFVSAYGFSQSNYSSTLYFNSSTLKPEFSNGDSLLNYVYIDLEADRGNNYILNEHYFIRLGKKKILNDRAHIKGVFDTGLFDWDSQWYDPNRIRYLFEFYFFYFPFKNDKSINIVLNYGPGENTYYKKRVFERLISGFGINKKVGKFENSFRLNLKPTFTEESNIKQFKLNSTYNSQKNKKYKISAGIGWDYSTANTANIFDRSVNMDEKLSVYGEASSKRTFTKLHFTKDNKNNQAYYLYFRLMKNFRIPTTICFQANIISNSFFDTMLKNYYSDYNAISPLGELIGNGESFISSEVVLDFTPTLSILSGVHFRETMEMEKITTYRLKLIMEPIDNIQNGFEVIYANPETYGQGYQWELKYFIRFNI